MSGRQTPQRVALETLKEHPDQLQMFAPISDVKLQELAADLEKRGQQVPIEICEDGTIICGHQRVAAARSLGWTHIEAIVRDDLGDADDPRVRGHLIRDNVIRRQLDDLSLARCFRELKNLAEKEGWEFDGDVRDAIATQLGVGKSGRTLDRLERLLDLPGNFQDFITQGYLKKSQGEAILRLDEEDRDALYAAVLESGEDLNVVLRRYGVIRTKTETPIKDQASGLLKSLRRLQERTGEDFAQLDGAGVNGVYTLEALANSAEFLR